MSGNVRTIVLVVMALLTAAPATVGTAEAQNNTSPDFAKFLAWWPGDYSNLAQVAVQSDTPPSERNLSTLLFIRRVDLRAFGHDVYYAEWQAADDTTKIVRQRIYAFTPLPSGGATLALHIFPDKPDLVARTGGAYRDPRRLHGITPADMAGLQGCDVRRTAPRFIRGRR